MRPHRTPGGPDRPSRHPGVLRLVSVHRSVAEARQLVRNGEWLGMCSVNKGVPEDHSVMIPPEVHELGDRQRFRDVWSLDTLAADLVQVDDVFS
jgi:hypothetical protein